MWFLLSLAEVWPVPFLSQLCCSFKRPSKTCIPIKWYMLTHAHNVTCCALLSAMNVKCSFSFAQKTTFGNNKWLSHIRQLLFTNSTTQNWILWNWYVRVCAKETDTIPVPFSVYAWFHCSGYVNIKHKILMYVPCILYSFLSRPTNLLIKKSE